mmetsp:Transcript_7837/g.11970  ORF Transcript_7837/g.11970 Transcript_7837/m.11970 type:complete len:643 (-) Transcript_7837:175-2103(-)
MKQRSSSSRSSDRMLRSTASVNSSSSGKEQPADDSSDNGDAFSVHSVVNSRYKNLSRSEMAKLLEIKEDNYERSSSKNRSKQEEPWWTKAENLRGILILSVLAIILVKMNTMAAVNNTPMSMYSTSATNGNLRAASSLAAVADPSLTSTTQQKAPLPPGYYHIGDGQVATLAQQQPQAQQQPPIVMAQPQYVVQQPPQYVQYVQPPQYVAQQPQFVQQPLAAAAPLAVSDMAATTTADATTTTTTTTTADAAAQTTTAAVPELPAAVETATEVEEDATTALAMSEAAPTGEQAPISTEFFPTEASGEINPDIPLETLNLFKDAWDPWEKTDTAVFWHIPKAGGSTIKDTIGGCHRKIWASEFGVTDGHDKDTEIAVVYPAGGEAGLDRSPFVNVDTTTVAGIERAKQMGFADSGLADAVVTPFIYEANELFTETAKGRLFTVFRHPIDRAVSMFYYLQVATWEPTYKPELKEWTIEQYAKSDIVENNWMTRQLANALSGDLTDDHLKIAMEVIRRKFLVGLMTEIDKTMSRAEQFFHWNFHVNPVNQEKCRETLMGGGANSNSKNKKEKPKPGDPAYEALSWQNNYDLQLYAYIEKLFVEQEQLVADMPDDYRNVDATCCKCNPPTFPPEGFECPVAVVNDR